MDCTCVTLCTVVMGIMTFYQQLTEAVDYSTPLCRYQYHQTKMAWTSARAICESTNRTLLQIDNVDEMGNITNDLIPFVKEMKPSSETISDVLWIGLHQEINPVRLMWDDCNEYIITTGEWAVSPGTTEGCIIFNITSSTYALRTCSEAQSFICEDLSQGSGACYREVGVSSPDIPDGISYDGSTDLDETREGCARLCYESYCIGYQLDPMTDGSGKYVCHRHYFLENPLGLSLGREPNVISLTNVYILSDSPPANTPVISNYYCPIDSTTIQPTTPVTEPNSYSSMDYSSQSEESSALDTSSWILSTTAADILTSSYVESGTTTSDCFCPCTVKLSSTSITTEELQAKIEQIQSELTLDKKDTSSYKRKLISAPDNRVSAQSIGYVGVVILTIVIGLLVCIDIPTIVKDTQKFVQRFCCDCKK